MDILCLDTEKNPFIVELKRGSSSDRAVGQILRYMAG
jgi:RecB family endonuclease NucS